MSNSKDLCCCYDEMKENNYVCASLMRWKLFCVVINVLEEMNCFVCVLVLND
jgi:hypothetical protein